VLKQGTQEKEDLELKSVEAHGEWWQGVNKHGKQRQGV